MSADSEHRRQAEESCAGFLRCWTLVCLIGLLIFGWPVILSWLVTTWALTAFLSLLTGKGNSP